MQPSFGVLLSSPLNLAAVPPLGNDDSSTTESSIQRPGSRWPCLTAHRCSSFTLVTCSAGAITQPPTGWPSQMIPVKY